MQHARLGSLSRHRLASHVAALAALSVPLVAQGSIQGIGYGTNTLICTGMSSDTHAIAGYTTQPGTSGANVWLTGAPNFVYIGGDNGAQQKVSDNGFFISSTIPDPNNPSWDVAGRWSSATSSWQSLGGLASQSGNSVSTAYDMSRDGQTIVGLGWVSAGTAHGFRWTPAGGMVDLGSLTGFSTSSRANAVSADGTTIVGWDRVNGGPGRAVRWVNLVESQLGSLDASNPIYGPGEGWGASSNGTWIVGTSAGKAFRWSAATGLLNLGQLGGVTTTATSVTDDGKIVVGSNGSTAFIWTVGTGIMDLQTYLVNLGITDAANWSLRTAVDISADGTKIAGHGINQGGTAQPWLVELPVPVPVVYCTAGTTTNGCTPSISATHNPSLTGAFACVIDVTGVEGLKSGIIFYGLLSNSSPWANGSTSLLCVKAPSQRTGVQASGGSLGFCDGTLTLDWVAYQAAHPTALGQPWHLGNKAYLQGWFRDPPAPKTTNLSNAVEITYLP